MVALEVTALDRSLWREAFPPDQIPRFPCPNCQHGSRLWSQRGRLTATLSDLHIEVPALAPEDHAFAIHSSGIGEYTGASRCYTQTQSRA